MSEKKGQGVDKLKKHLVEPAVRNALTKVIQLPAQGLRFADIGAGDGSSLVNLLHNVPEICNSLFHLAVLDIDPGILTKLFSTIFEAFDTIIPNISLTDLSDPQSYEHFVCQNKTSFDVIQTQFALHHIFEANELESMACFVSQLLAPNGWYVSIDLHPKYITFLQDHYPEKFITLEQTERYVQGAYRFDNGGENEVFVRTIEALFSYFFEHGLRLQYLFDLYMPQEISREDERSTLLFETETPLFYLSLLQKHA